MSRALRIAGMGMVSAIGLTANETCTSIESGVRRFRETPILGLSGHPLIASLVVPVSAELTLAERASLLLEPALAECIAQAKMQRRARTALLLCTPPQRLPPLPEPFASVFGEAGAAWGDLPELVTQRIHDAHGLRVQTTALFDGGHAAGIEALGRAAELLASDEVDQCLLGGVDSAGARGILERLDLLGESKSARVPTGLIPGEASAFLCLVRAHEGPREQPCVHVASAWHTREASPETASGDALTVAMAGALAAWGGDPRAVRLLLADLNGDRGRARESAFATLRTLFRAGALPEIAHPADRLGDIGASSAPLLLGLAARRLESLALGSAAMVTCASSSPLRAAAVLEICPGAGD
jgi:3-oxoacyl-[acyl-carrier-protein] synthase-1